MGCIHLSTAGYSKGIARVNVRMAGPSCTSAWVFNTTELNHFKDAGHSGLAYAQSLVGVSVDCFGLVRRGLDKNERGLDRMKGDWTH